MGPIGAMVLGALAASASVGPTFSPGEETVLDVTYLKLPAGEARIHVGRPEGDVWPVIFQVRSGGAASVVDVREQLVSYWDSAAQLPRGSDLRAVEVGDAHADSSRFDRARGELTVSVERGGRRTSSTYPVAPDTHEVSSALLWLRLRPLAVGDRFALPVASGGRQSTLSAEVVGRETIETPAGTFPCLRVQVRTGFDGKFATRRDTSLWLSDDARHVLVRFSADFAIGSVVATLRSYRPGVAVAAAPSARPPGNGVGAAP